MEPHLSYRIWFSNRNGSTLLSQTLTDTGVAGKPGEFFNKHDCATLAEKHQVDSYESLKHQLWKLGTSSNGVFGIKHAVTKPHFESIEREICRLRSIPYTSAASDFTIWDDLFPNCKHIYLTRRNKVRQAVSWWKAINDNRWHLLKEEAFEDSEAFYEQHYDVDALTHLFKEATLRECAMEEYFSNYQIKPLTVVYEDFIRDYDATIRRILEFLGINGTDVEIPPMYSRPTATDKSEIWVQRFRKDLQGDTIVW